MKKYWAMLLCCSLCVSTIVQMPVYAASNVVWTLDAGVLNISGEGTMPNYAYGKAPWHDQAESITEVVIGDKVTSIGAYAFADLTEVTDVQVGNRVETIGAGAFYGCENLTEVKLPESVQVLKTGCFAKCSELEYFSADNLVKVENYAFQQTDFDEFYITEDLVELSEYAFYKAGLERFMEEERNETYSVKNGVLYTEHGKKLYLYPAGNKKTIFVVPNGVTSIGTFAFGFNQNLKTVTIASSVDTIETAAFQEAQCLYEITIPDAVEHVGQYAFYKCKMLEKVAIQGLEEIPYQTFMGCSSLTTLALEEGIQEIRGSAFAGCENLQSVTIPESATFVHEQAFPVSTAIDCRNKELKKYGANGYRLLQDVVIQTERNYTYAYEVLELINAKREKEGLTQLKMNDKLLEAAMTRAGEIVVLYSHTRPDGSDFSTLDTRLKTEIRAYGEEYPEDVVATWMQDSEFLKNLLTEDVGSVGVGCVSYNGVQYWVQCFGTTATEGDAQQGKGSVVQKQVISFAVDPFVEAGTPDSINENKNYYLYEPKIAVDTVLNIGERTTAHVSVTNPCIDNGEVAIETTGITWSSDDAAVLHVESGGMITAGICGTANLTAKLKYYELTESVKVAYEDVLRVYGKDRYKTSYAIADALKKELDVERFATVIVADGTNFPDALAGSYLAAKKNAPIILVNGKAMSRNEETVVQVCDYIAENLATDGTVYLLGGESAVPLFVESALREMMDVVGWENGTVKRLAGKNRYETNLKILAETGVEDEDIIICTGDNFADSLSASATGCPIFLVGESLSPEQEAFLKAAKKSSCYIVGGENAVNEAIYEQVAAFCPTKRISGANRYETSVRLAQEEKFFEHPHLAVTAYAYNFPDGLCGGSLAYAMRVPLILTGANLADHPSEAAQRKAASKAADYMAAENIAGGIVLGGSNALTDYTVRYIFNMNDEDNIIKR